MWSHDDFFFFTVIGGKWINITIDITVGKYNLSSLSDGFDKVVTTFMCLFTSSTLVKLKITYLCVCNATVQLHVCQSIFMFLVGK